MAKCKVKFAKSYTRPEVTSVLEVNGQVVPGSERTIEAKTWYAGDEEEFRSKKDALAFIKTTDNSAYIV